MSDEKTEDLGLERIFSDSSLPSDSGEKPASPKADKAVDALTPINEPDPAGKQIERNSAIEKEAEEKAAGEAVQTGIKKESAEEKKPETEPQVNWDSEDNPWKKRQIETHGWSRRLSAENAEIKRQLNIVNAKLDDTYNPEENQESEPTREEIESEAEIKGRIKASEALAYELHGGKEAVEAKLKIFNDKFGQNQFVQYRVLNSDAPIIEALKVVKESSIVEKYGTSDPEKIIEAVKKEAEKDLRAKITEEETKKIMARLDKREQSTPSLADVRAAGKENGKESNEFTPLNEIF